MMNELDKPMSWEESLVYPRKLGWKYECLGDALHVSPAWTAIAKFSRSLVNLGPLREYAMAKQPLQISIRPVEPRDQPQLISLFCESFYGSIDYAGRESASLMAYAHKNLDRLFGPTQPRYVGASRVAVEEERVVGCCLIVRGKRGPLLQPIFVAPSLHRRGVATNLLFESLQSLAGQSESRINSRCNLGNEASMAWHLQCGFIELPCRWAAGHRANIYMQEAMRQELLQLPTADAMHELAEFWGNQRALLERDLPIDDF